MYTKNFISLSVCQHLHETICIHTGFRPPTRFKGKRSSLILSSLFLQLLFGITYRRNFRPCINNPWNQVIIDVGFLTCNSFCDIYAFILGLMSQHCSFNYITNSINPWHCCLQVIIYRDFISSFFSFDSDIFQSKPRSISGTSYSYNAVISLKCYTFTFSIICCYSYFLTFYFGTGYFMAHKKLHTKRFLQHTLELLTKTSIHRSDDRWHEFDHRHLCPQARVYRTQLKPDHTPTNHNHLLRYLSNIQSLCRGNDTFLINRKERQRSWLRT